MTEQRRKSLNRLMFIAGYALAIVVGVYAALVAVLYFTQEKLIFAGSRLAPGYKFAFGTQRFEEIRVNVPGATLHALHFMQPAPRGLVFFLHGNGGDLSTWTTGIDFYERAGYDLFIFDYRGYGLSTGRIESEAQLHADTRTMWDTIAPSYRERNLPIVIYGRSLGTGLATPLARDVDPALLVLVTPFTSLAAMATRLYPFVPQWANRYPLRTDAVIADVRSPIVLVHGTRDALIPFDESVALLMMAKSRAELIKVDGAGHNDIHQFPVYIDGLALRLGLVAAR